MKKSVICTLWLALILFSLASCSFGGGDKGDETLDTGERGWTPGEDVYIVAEQDLGYDMTLLANLLTKNGFVAKAADKVPEGKAALTVGLVGDEVSESAYRALERKYDAMEGYSRYLVYSSGSTVSLAYDGLMSRYAVVDAFIEQFGSVDLSVGGTVISEQFNSRAYASERRAEIHETEIEKLRGHISDGAIENLKKLYSTYDESIYIWLANLWDPDTGGFYYSESARDTNGFLPDIESTVQALMFLENSGLLAHYGNNYANALSDEAKSALLSFAKEMQDSEDGFFYHQQWGKNISITRRGRDLGWAVRLIRKLGSKPYYNTPNGFEGEYGEPGASAAALTGRLGNSRVSAVSVVVPTASVSYLESPSAFREYLESLDFETNSYGAGNTLDTLMGQIGAKGQEYKDLLIEFLNSKQYAHNGLWEQQTDYDSVNGLMKISGLYTSCKATIPNAEAAMRSAMEVALTVDGAAHVCSVYNPWVSMVNTLDSVKKVDGRERADELRAMLCENAEELIKITLDKLVIFRKDDGGFSYYPKNSATRSQGATVALGGARESDVNATGICTNGTVSNMLEAFGFDDIPRFCPEDLAVFFDEFSDLGTIVKDEIPKVETITFDGYDSSDGMEVSGVVTYPDDYVINYIGDSEENSDGNYKWFESAVVNNPDPNAKKGDKVLYASQKTYSGEEKNVAISASGTWFEIANAGIGSSGNCFVYDADMYFASGNGVIAQLFFTGERDENRPCVSLNIETYTEGGVKYVKIGENYAGLDGKKDAGVAGGIPFGKWVNVRIEVHKIVEEVEDPKTGLVSTEYTPKIKVFVDGKYQGECDANITGGGIYYNRSITNVSISYYRFSSSEIYFNNVHVERTMSQYTEETNPDAIVDVPIPDEPMRESYGFEDGLLNTSNVRNKVNITYLGASLYFNATADQTYNPYISYSIVDDPAGVANKVLRVDTKKTTEFQASKTEVHLYNSESEGTTYTFSGDFYYDSSSIGTLSDLTQLFFTDANGKSNYAVRIVARKLGGATVLSLIEYNTKATDGDTGTGRTVYENIPCNAWFNLKIDFHKTGSSDTTVAKYYIDGKEVFDDRSYKASALGTAELVSVNISHQRTNRSTVYLDDLSFVRCDKEFVPMPEPNPTADFEAGVAAGDFLNNYINALDSENNLVSLNAKDVTNMSDYSAFTTFDVVNDPSGSENKVLKVVKKKNDKAASSTTSVGLGKFEADSSCFVFESDMYIESIGAYDVMRINFSDGSNNLIGFRLYVEGGKIKLRQNNGGTGGTGTGNVLDYSGNVLTLPKSAWFTLRIEYYKADEENDTACKIYFALRGEELLPVAEMKAHTPYGNNPANTPSKVTVEHYNKGNGYTIYFDNVAFSSENEAFVSSAPTE